MANTTLNLTVNLENSPTHIAMVGLRRHANTIIREEERTQNPVLAQLHMAEFVMENFEVIHAAMVAQAIKESVSVQDANDA